MPRALADVLRSAGRVVVIWGDRIAREGDSAVSALLDVASALELDSKEGSGLLEVPELANARGLREAGCLPDAGPGLTTPALTVASTANAAVTGKGDRGDPGRARGARAEDPPPLRRRPPA